MPASVLADLGLSAQALARDIVERVASLEGAPLDALAGGEHDPLPRG